MQSYVVKFVKYHKEIKVIVLQDILSNSQCACKSRIYEPFSFNTMIHLMHCRLYLEILAHLAGERERDKNHKSFRVDPDSSNADPDLTHQKNADRDVFFLS